MTIDLECVDRRISPFLSQSYPPACFCSVHSPWPLRIVVLFSHFTWCLHWLFRVRPHFEYSLISIVIGRLDLQSLIGISVHLALLSLFLYLTQYHSHGISQAHLPREATWLLTHCSWTAISGMFITVMAANVCSFELAGQCEFPMITMLLMSSNTLAV